MFIKLQRINKLSIIAYCHYYLTYIDTKRLLKVISDEK